LSQIAPRATVVAEAAPLAREGASHQRHAGTPQLAGGTLTTVAFAAPREDAPAGGTSRTALRAFTARAQGLASRACRASPAGGGGHAMTADDAVAYALGSALLPH
jgi:hypothetical protein